MAGPLELALNEKLHNARMKVVGDTEADAIKSREKLRSFTAQLREPGQPHSHAPASQSIPTFKIGDAHNFPFVTALKPTTPGNGHLSAAASTAFISHMADAATRNDPISRDAATSRAANAVANDYAKQHNLLRDPKESIKATVLHEARAQVVFASREIGEKLGLGPAQSSVIGYSLERALEKEGFKVFVNHAIDKTVDVFKATTSSTATATGMKNTAESTLNKSMQWMAARGVTPEALKGIVGNHAGKISALVSMSQNPEVVQRAAQIISHSDKGANVVLALAKDTELRKAVGTMTLQVGETLAHVNKGAGSVAILAGSALRGDSMEDTGRHAFRAALSVLGGAGGAIAAGAVSAGFGSIAGGIGGAAAGSAAADYLLKVYDKHFNNGITPDASKVSQQDLAGSKAVLGQHLKEAGKDIIKDSAKEHSPGMTREFTMSKSN